VLGGWSNNIVIRKYLQASIKIFTLAYILERTIDTAAHTLASFYCFNLPIYIHKLMDIHS